MIRLFMTQCALTALIRGIVFLRVVAPFYFVVAVKLMADGVLRGQE